MTRFRGYLVQAVAAAAILAATSAGSLAANLITYNFAGTVDSVDAALGDQFSVGDAIIGSFTFDSTATALPGSDPTTAVFNALTSFSVQVGSVYFGTSSAGAEVQVGNQGTTPPSSSEATDRFSVVSRVSDGLSGMSFPSAVDASLVETLVFFGLRLDQNAGTLFGDATSLPTGFSLADFDSAGFFMAFDETTAALVTVDPGLSGTLTRFLAVTAVPEPATLALFGIGLFGFGALRRKYRAA